MRFFLAHRNPFARNGRWTSKAEVKLRFYLAHRIGSGYTYMAVWIGGLEVWEIRVMCKIDLKNVCFFLCVLYLFYFLFNYLI